MCRASMLPLGDLDNLGVLDTDCACMWCEPFSSTFSCTSAACHTLRCRVKSASQVRTARSRYRMALCYPLSMLATLTLIHGFLKTGCSCHGFRWVSRSNWALCLVMTREDPVDSYSVILFRFGFLMTFLAKYGFSAVGINFVLSALAIQVLHTKLSSAKNGNT